jgi:hypothetical protein
MQSLSENNICFVANYSKTYFFHAIAQQLLQQGYSIFWVVVGRKLREYLLESYHENQILYLNKQCEGLPTGKIGEFKLNELVYGDRTLKYTPEEGIRYLLRIQQPIYDFIKTNRIRYIFGEFTWAHELLIKRITENKPELNCRFLNPAGVRIPDGRFAFFTAEFESELLIFDGSAEFNMSHTEHIKAKKPDYLAANDMALHRLRSIPERLKRIRRFITGESMDSGDPTLIDKRWVRLRVRCKEELNWELYRFVKRLTLDEVGDRKFVFLALHKQPEASIDVVGRYYENQFTNVVNLWRITPDDWLVLVKEHSNAVGDRGLRFFTKLSRLPNLYFLREDEDSHEVIRRSQLVVTVSGTVAYEAALLGKTAVTLVPTFFSRVPNCRHIGLEDLRKARDIYDIIGRTTPIVGELEAFVLKNSFPGIISDPISDPRSMDPENIRNVATAIMYVTRL